MPNTEDDFDDDLDCEDDLEEIISQASCKFSQSSSQKDGLVESEKATGSEFQAIKTFDRLDQVKSQAVDFTATKDNAISIPSLKGSNTILVNSNQRQNPLLQNLRTVRYVITDSIAPAHYILFDSCCGIFLSLKYHVIHPNYIYERISELQNKYLLKVLLVLMDHVIYEQSLKELTILAVRTNFTLLLAWTYEEAARHLENYRLNADKAPDIIMGRFDYLPTVSSSKSSSSGATSAKKTEDNICDTSVVQQNLIESLTTIKSVNRTDAVTLISTFDSLDSIINADMDELMVCPGISMLKARRMHELFHKPFIKSKDKL